MMMIKYLIDTDSPVRLREVAAPTAEFADHIAPIRHRARAGAHGEQADR